MLIEQPTQVESTGIFSHSNFKKMGNWTIKKWRIFNNRLIFTNYRDPKIILEMKFRKAKNGFFLKETTSL